MTNFKGGASGKEPPLPIQEMQVRSLDCKDPLEEGMTTHSSILAWRIPWTEEPGGLQFMGSQRVRHGCRNLARMHAMTNSTKPSVLNMASDSQPSLDGPPCLRFQFICACGSHGALVSLKYDLLGLQRFFCLLQWVYQVAYSTSYIYMEAKGICQDTKVWSFLGLKY